MAKRRPIQTRKQTRFIRPTVIILGDGETEKSYIKRLKQLDLYDHVNLKYEKGNEFNFETKIKEHDNDKNVIVISDVDNSYVWLRYNYLLDGPLYDDF